MQPEIIIIQTIKDGTINEDNPSGEIIPYFVTISQMETLKSIYQNIEYYPPLESQVIDIINSTP